LCAAGILEILLAIEPLPLERLDPSEAPAAPTLPMKHPALLLLALAPALLPAQVMIDFNSSGDYDTRFVEVEGGSSTSHNIAGGNISRSTVATTSTVAIYNANATGGVGGSGGTTFNATRQTYGGSMANMTAFVIQSDIQFGALTSGLPSSTSFGFYTKVPTGEASGYAGLFRLGSTAGADFRLFDSNGNPDTAAVGSSLGSLTANTTQLGFTPTANTWYTLRLQVADVGSDVAFTASITDIAANVTYTLGTLTDTSSAVLGAGQAGFRLSVNTGGTTPVYVDNFAISMVPEPGTALTLLTGFAALAVRRRRSNPAR